MKSKLLLLLLLLLLVDFRYFNSITFVTLAICLELKALIQHFGLLSGFNLYNMSEIYGSGGVLVPGDNFERILRYVCLKPP